MRKAMLVWIVIVLMGAVAGCTCAPEPVATTKPLPTADAAMAALTDVPTATPTPFPTGEPVPTDTPAPTPTRASTVAPTDTPAPTLTPTPSATATPSVVLTRIGDVTAARAGEEVTVEGEVVGTASFSAGFKFTLDDGTGQIVLLMWHNVYDDCWDAPEINLGARVRATGEVGEYEGELQIEPGFGGDVKAIEGAAPWAPPRDIGSLSGSDEGQRVMVEGRVIRVEGRGTWAKVFVGDETGEVLVYIYENVLARIPNNTALGVEGTRVRVVGTVAIYDYNLEVVPALPYDVMVLE
jgi:DNA/RNA endonuclease YhcR with UshA esterase domain